MLAERSKADVEPWDYEKIQMPSVLAFIAMMEGKFVGQEVLPSTIQAFMDFAELRDRREKDPRLVAVLLYSPVGTLELQRETC